MPRRKGEEGPKGQLEYFPTSLRCFPCPPKRAGKFSHSFWERLTESLNSSLCWAVRSQHRHLFLSPALPVEAQLARNYVLCLSEWLCFYVCPFTVNRQNSQMHFSGTVLLLQLKPGAAAGSTELVKAALRKAESY